MTVYYEREKGVPMPERLKQEVDKAMERPVVFDEDCPQMTEEMKKAFMAVRKKKPCNMRQIMLYLSGDTVDRAIEIFGENYSEALGKLLDSAVRDYAVR